MRPLLIGKAERVEIQRVRKYAEAHRYTLADLERLAQAAIEDPEAEAIGENPGHRCCLPVGFRVVYSIEEQPGQWSWSHHLSVSVDTPERAPNLTAVQWIAAAFGMFLDYDAPDFAIYRENDGTAVNVIQSIDKTGRAWAAQKIKDNPHLDPKKQ